MESKFLLFAIATLLMTIFSSCQNNVQEDLGSFEGYEINNPSAIKPTSGIKPIDIYGINDFHGAINENYKEAGLANVGTFIKQKSSLPNTLFIDSGDSWQGSLESNYNFGKLVTEVYNNAKISVKTLGNHEFDWGTSILETNVKSSTFPILASNVYDFHFNDKKDGNKQQKQFGKSYATYVLDNGLKIGIIGTIDEQQITSISSQLVENISFKKQQLLIQKISDFLRTEKKCDIIIASTHSSFEQLKPEELTKTSSISGKRYVDLVLNAHTHKSEVFTVNNVNFAQFGANGEQIGKITLYYNFETNELVDLSTNINLYSKTDIINEINNQIDPEIEQIINNYSVQTKDLGKQVLTTNLSGYFYSSEQLPNLMAEAIYYEAINQGYTVDFAYTNGGRASHYGTSMDYSELYNIFPFDNSISVIEVTGKQATNMLRFRNNIYRADPDQEIRYDGVYKVACIDYLAFHCDEKRNYDFFPNQKVLGFLKKNNEVYYYREILKDYLLSNPNKHMNSNEYSFDNPVFRREVNFLY